MHIHQRLVSAIALVLGILLGYLIISSVVDYRLKNTVSFFEAEARTVDGALTALAEIISRLGYDSVADGIVVTCSTDERANYNILLSNLDSQLSVEQLQKLDSLFGRCGYTAFQRRSILTLQLQHALERYKAAIDAITQLSGPSGVESARLKEWQALVAAEVVQTNDFRELTIHQDLIIQTLLQGASRTSEDIQTILQMVQATQERMAVQSIQLTQLRSELLN